MSTEAMAEIIESGKVPNHQVTLDETASGNRFCVECSCGWFSDRTYAVRLYAVHAAVKHLGNVYKGDQRPIIEGAVHAWISRREAEHRASTLSDTAVG